MAIPFEIHPVQARDLSEIFTVSEKAFEAINPVVFKTLPLSAKTIELMAASRAEAFGKDPQATSFKAVDPSSGGIIGVAYWEVHGEDEVVDKSVEEEVSGGLALDIPERHDDSSIAYYTMLASGKRDVLGIPGEGSRVEKLKKRVELSSLVVHPDFQGKGIGKELMKWGLEEAERLGLPLYLESTSAGRPLYEKIGFEPLKEATFDAREFGADVVAQVTFMMKPPKASA
ncbi:acyl-CoA N-acyltransferase [Aspergillus varians]